MPLFLPYSRLGSSLTGLGQTVERSALLTDGANYFVERKEGECDGGGGGGGGVVEVLGKNNICRTTRAE